MDENFYQTDELTMWVEAESSVHIKAVTKQGDPVEFSFDEIEKIVEVLTKWMQKYK